ncbi:MAG TPA: response regulator [Pyrinomonadaceae bacterium]|nr:response regulator [Pyrinomonadaceae bacterium]
MENQIESDSESTDDVYASGGGGAARANVAGKGRALIIDDSVDITLMLDMILRRAGYQTYTAFTGADALRAARSTHFDLILSDIGMPLMNGYELCAELRKMADYSEVPLVAITGYAHYEDRDEALKCGFNALLNKPIDPSNLLAVIEDLRAQTVKSERPLSPS